MSYYVRTKEGMPELRDFASGEGTPIVIDKLNDSAWYLSQNVPRSIQPYQLTTVQASAGIGINAQKLITLNNGWTRITNYNSTVSSNPIGYTRDMAAGTITPLFTSNAQVLINLSIGFDESNSGRVTYFRIFNVTLNTVVPNFSVRASVGRNTSGLLIGQNILHNLIKDYAYALEIGGGDVFTNARIDLGQYAMVDTFSVNTIDVITPAGRGFSSAFSAGYQ